MSAGKEGNEWEELAVCCPLALGPPPGTSEWPERDKAGVPALCKPGGGGSGSLQGTGSLRAFISGVLRADHCG